MRETLSIEQIRVSAYRIPTDAHESDGTFEWDATTLVIVEAMAAETIGIGLRTRIRQQPD